MWGWDYWEKLGDILALLADPGKHFILSASVGLLVSSLMYSVFSVSFWMVRYVRLRFMEPPVKSGSLPITSMDVAFGITISSLLLGLSLALALHFFLDGLFNTPLNPPLDPDLSGLF